MLISHVPSKWLNPILWLLHWFSALIFTLLAFFFPPCNTHACVFIHHVIVTWMGCESLYNKIYGICLNFSHRLVRQCQRFIIQNAGIWFFFFYLGNGFHSTAALDISIPRKFINYSITLNLSKFWRRSLLNWYTKTHDICNQNNRKNATNCYFLSEVIVIDYEMP